MNNKMKKRVGSLVVAMMLSISSIASPATPKAKTEKYTYLGVVFAAKGEPKVFKESKKGKIKIVSSAGNKYKVNGNTFTVICKKEGKIKYEIAGKKKSFKIDIEYDTKVNKKEYDLPTDEYYKGKEYSNFIDIVRDIKKDSLPFGEIVFSGKEEIEKVAKYNRNIKYEQEPQGLWEKYPDCMHFDEKGYCGKTDCYWAAPYYDTKSGYTVEKAFVLNKKDNVVKISYTFYNPKYKDEYVILS